MKPCFPIISAAAAATDSTTAPACANCPHHPANASAETDTSASIGHQITQHIAALSPTERRQMLALIDSILAANHQPRPANRPARHKRSKR